MLDPQICLNIPITKHGSRIILKCKEVKSSSFSQCKEVGINIVSKTKQNDIILFDKLKPDGLR